MLLQPTLQLNHPGHPAAALPQPNSQGEGKLIFLMYNLSGVKDNRFSIPSSLKEKHLDLATKIFLILYYNKKSEQ